MFKSELEPISNFRQILRRLHNHLYGGGPIKSESQLADEIARIVLCKIADEISPSDECKFFASSEELAGPLGHEIVLGRIRELQKLITNGSESEFILGPYWVAQTVSLLQKYSLLSNKSYVSPLADVYEVFNSGQFKGGRGQFFTPPVIVNLAFKLLDPNPSDIVIDPACGSGNFLSKAITKHCIPGSSSLIDDLQMRISYSKNNLYGVDIEPGLVQIANRLLTLLSGEINGNVRVGDSLDLASPLYRDFPLGKFTKLFTNPPFGTNIAIKDKRILEQFDLGHELSNGIPTNTLLDGQDPDRLFLELCIKLLSVGGEAAIVLPRQILSGDERYAIEIRKWLLMRVTVLAVIDLPQETFQPFTGTITSLIVFRKGKPEKDYPVFFSVCENVGHDRRGHQLVEINDDGSEVMNEKGVPKIKDDTLEIVKRWIEYSSIGAISTTDRLSFMVPSTKISNHHLHLLNAWAYNPSASGAYRRVIELSEENELEVLTLGDVCDSIFIPGRHKRRYVESNDNSIPFLSTAQIFHIHEIDFKYQPREMAVDKDLVVDEGWLLITRSGSTGRVRYVNRELSKFAISEHCIRIVPNDEQIDGGYLYAYLSSSIGQLLIDQGRYASVIEAISHKRLMDIPILLPTRAVQKQIGDMVRSSERMRVNANRKRQQALEDIETLLGKL